MGDSQLAKTMTAKKKKITNAAKESCWNRMKRHEHHRVEEKKTMALKLARACRGKKFSLRNNIFFHLIENECLIYIEGRIQSTTAELRQDMIPCPKYFLPIEQLKLLHCELWSLDGVLRSPCSFCLVITILEVLFGGVVSTANL